MDTNNAGNNLPVVTTDLVKAKFSLALSKVNFALQQFIKRAESLVIDDDPDNLAAVSEFLKDGKYALKVIDDTHTEVKKPHLEAGRSCDTAKNDMVSLFEGVIRPISEKYTAKCNEIDRKQKEAELKEQKRQQIITGVESNILDFATRIAGCKTKKDLTEVESLINLEKSPSRASKYGEWHEFAIGRYNEALIPVIKDQKTKVEEYEKLAAKLEKEVDPEKADKLKDQLATKENEIIQNQVNVQEYAISHASIPVSNEVEEVLPDLTKAGSNMEVEIVDLKLVFKKHPELLKIELKALDTKKLGSTLRDAGAFNGQDELIFDGIKFKIAKRWK